jgi:hypothetical protein
MQKKHLNEIVLKKGDKNTYLQVWRFHEGKEKVRGRYHVMSMLGGSDTAVECNFPARRPQISPIPQTRYHFLKLGLGDFTGSAFECAVIQQTPIFRKPDRGRVKMHSFGQRRHEGGSCGSFTRHT